MAPSRPLERLRWDHRSLSRKGCDGAIDAAVLTSPRRRRAGAVARMSTNFRMFPLVSRLAEIFVVSRTTKLG